MGPEALLLEAYILAAGCFSEGVLEDRECLDSFGQTGVPNQCKGMGMAEAVTHGVRTRLSVAEKSHLGNKEGREFPAMEERACRGRGAGAGRGSPP